MWVYPRHSLINSSQTIANYILLDGQDGMEPIRIRQRLASCRILIWYLFDLLFHIHFFLIYLFFFGGIHSSATTTTTTLLLPLFFFWDLFYILPFLYRPTDPSFDSYRFIYILSVMTTRPLCACVRARACLIHFIRSSLCHCHISTPYTSNHPFQTGI